MKPVCDQVPLLPAQTAILLKKKMFLILLATFSSFTKESHRVGLSKNDSALCMILLLPAHHFSKCTVTVEMMHTLVQTRINLFFFQLLPLEVVVDHFHDHLHLTLPSSSITPALCTSSFTTSINLLCGLPVFYLLGSSIFNILHHIHYPSVLHFQTISSLPL